MSNDDTIKQSDRTRAYIGPCSTRGSTASGPGVTPHDAMNCEAGQIVRDARFCPGCHKHFVPPFADLCAVCVYRGAEDLGLAIDEPHGPPAWLGRFMLALLILVAFGLAVTAVLAIVHARSVP